MRAMAYNQPEGLRISANVDPLDKGSPPGLVFMSHAPAKDWPPDCFRNRFCRFAGCAPENFADHVARACLHDDHRLLARLYWHWDRESFEPDLKLIQALGRLTTYNECEAEIDNYRKEWPITGMLRKQLRLRVSGKCLLKLARKLFTEPPPQAPAAS